MYCVRDKNMWREIRKWAAAGTAANVWNMKVEWSENRGE